MMLLIGRLALDLTAPAVLGNGGIAHEYRHLSAYN